MYEELRTREIKKTPEGVLKSLFDKVIHGNQICDALFIYSSFENVIGVSNLKYKAPIVLELLFPFLKITKCIMCG
jgi:cellobiose phosphorylase